MRRRLIVCNWKMAMTLEETRRFVAAFRENYAGEAENLDLVVCPPATALATLADAAQETPIQVGAQTVSPHADPAHTGQLSGALLADAGATWVLIRDPEGAEGGDADELLNAQVHRALEAGLRPILFLGEGEPGEDASLTLQMQIEVKELLDGCSGEEVRRMGFIYEPSWAIEGEEPASPKLIALGAQALRDAVSTHFGPEAGEEVPVIYGGNVTPRVAPALLTLELLDGLGMGSGGRDPHAVAALVRQVVESGGDGGEETRLWYWLLFESGLSTQRAKILLADWEEAGRTAAQALESSEDADLTPPQELPQMEAVRWNEAEYPDGLRALPLKLRPALLFHRGPRHLLARPRIHFPPSPLEEAGQEALREAADVLLGEMVLLSAVHGSDQARVLLEELAHAEGEVLLFARSGLEEVELSERERALLKAGRLLVVSPLPPSTPPSPDLESILERVEAAAADRRVVVGAEAPPPSPETPTLWIALEVEGEEEKEIPGVRRANYPAEILAWMGGLKVTPTPPAPPAEPAPPDGEPPLSPEETLRILEDGGNVPEALKRRLLGEDGED
jgi:triosephosphate isomerase